MDVVLVVPPGNEGIGSYDSLDYPGLGYLLSYLRAQNLQATGINGAIDVPDHQVIATMINHLCPKILGFSVCTEKLVDSCKEILSNLGTSPRPVVAMGGHYATHNPDRLLEENPWIDVVIVGEGELTLAELSTAVCRGKTFQDILGTVVRRDGRVFANAKRPILRDLDLLPIPARDNAKSILSRGGVLCITASRGCVGRCKFCSISAFCSRQGGPRWRGRSISNILDEIEFLQQQFGIDHVWFVDDSFLPPGRQGRKRVADFAREVKRRQINIRFSIECRVTEINEDVVSELKEIGLRRVFVGIESGVQRVLDLFEKGVSVEDNIRACTILKDFGICTSIGFIMFQADISFQEVYANLSFLKSYHIDGPIPLFTSLQPITGVDWDWGRVCGLFRDARVEKLYNIFALFYRNIYLALNEISDSWWRTKCWLKDERNLLGLSLDKIMLEANQIMLQAFERSYVLAGNSRFNPVRSDLIGMFEDLVLTFQGLASITSLAETYCHRENVV